MKRTLVLLIALSLLVAACATTSAPSTNGVITAVNGNQVTVAGPHGDGSTTYTITRSTNIYAPDGVISQRAYLTPGQKVLVWANGTNAVRINISAS
jgi:hypothetical protein